MKPEDALAQARARAADRVAAGGYAEEPGLKIEPTERVSLERLLRYAYTEPDVSFVRSTRPGLRGRLVTGVKRGLLWSLRQYHGQLIAQQVRFNVHAVTYITALEDRVAALERENERLRSGGS